MRPQVSSIEAVKPMTIANHGPVHEIRKLLETREVGIFYSKLNPSGVLPLEVHAFTEVIYRIKGRTSMKIGEVEYIIEDGMVAVVPEGVWHQTTSLEETEFVEQLVLCAYSQVPGDFLLNSLKAIRQQAFSAPDVGVSASPNTSDQQIQ